MQGLVIKSTGSWYLVRGDNGQMYAARIAGKFRIKGIRATNPIAVGDVVDMRPEEIADAGFEYDTAVITGLHDRKNYIIRRSINLSKQVQVLAANLDLAVLVVTLASPRTSFGFIDRFLATCEAFSVPAMLLFNKLDLFSDAGMEVLDEVSGIYKNVGYDCMYISALEREGLLPLREVLKGKVTLVAGHSGVGKSTLINALTGLDVKTNEVSAWSDKGQHTTTFAEMHPLDDGGWIIDSPGIRELGIVDIEPRELGHYFKEIFKTAEHCKYYNCVHVNEPGCAVIKAVEDGEIAPTRYESYLSIYNANETRT